MNDDYFFGKQIHPSDFFILSSRRNNDSTPSSNDDNKSDDVDYGIKMFLEPTSYGIAENWKGEDQWPKSVRLTAQVVKEAYGEIFNEKTRITGESPLVLTFISLYWTVDKGLQDATVTLREEKEKEV